MSGTIYLTAREAFDAFRGFIELALVPPLEEVRDAAPTTGGAADVGRPDLPYATVLWLRSRALSSAPYRRVGDEVNPGDPDGATHEDVVQQVREGVVQLVAYGDAGPEQLDLLPLLKDQTTQQKYLQENGIACRPLGDVLDTRELRDTTFEASAAQEWAVIYAVESKGRIGTIETVTADLTLLGPGD